MTNRTETAADFYADLAASTNTYYANGDYAAFGRRQVAIWAAIDTAGAAVHDEVRRLLRARPI